MGNNDIVVELLSLGCDVNAVTSRGETALHYAVRCGQPHVAELILDAAKDINVDATTFNVSLPSSSIGGDIPKCLGGLNSSLPVAVLGKNIWGLAPHHLGGNNG